jgi:sulfatase maturation enzyme AslB (radical SAM superfamily)
MQIVEIEATNYCNTRCLHCPRENISRPLGMMTWDTFQVVADRILAYGRTTAIDFAGMGEPMLNSNLYRFIEYFSGKIDTYITTNASALTSRNIERLIESGLTTIIVSFNGAEAELYETMMGGLSFKRAESHLTDLMRRAKGRMQVFANVSVTKQTEGHLKNIKEYLNDVGVQNIIFSKCHSRGGHLKAPHVCDTPMPPVDTGRCDIYATTLFVSWTGDVLACCHDLDGVAALGSLITTSIEEIVARKQAVLQQGVCYEMCSDCNDLYRFAQDRLPGDSTISDWIYNLYLEPQRRMEFLNQMVQSRNDEISELSLRLQELENLIVEYEQGHFLSFLRQFGFWDYYQQGNHQSRQNSFSLGNGDSLQGDDVTLLDWMSLLYHQADENTRGLFSIIQRQEKRVEELTNRIEFAHAALEAYRQNPFIRFMGWVKSWSHLTLSL